MKRIYLLLNGDPEETFSQQIVNNGISSSSSLSGGSNDTGIGQVYVPTNQNAKKFLTNLTGKYTPDPNIGTASRSSDSPSQQEKDSPYSSSELATRNNKISKYGNPIKPGSINPFDVHGDIDNNDLFPSQTNAVAGSGSTPIWGAYPLWDAGVKFPFDLYYKDMAALQRMKLAAMQAKTQEVKPFNPEQVAASPNIQGPLDQEYLGRAISIGSEAVSRGGMMSDVHTDPNLSLRYYNNLGEYKGIAAQSKAVYDAATQINKDAKDNKIYVSPEVKDLADSYLSLSEQDAHSLVKSGKIKEVLPKILNKLETYQTVANNAEPIADRLVNGVLQNIQLAKDQDGKSIPIDQYGKYFMEHDTEEVSQKRLNDAADILVKQSPLLYGTNGTGQLNGKETPYTRKDALDYLTNRFSSKISDRLQIAYSPKVNTVKEAQETNNVPDVVGNIVTAANTSPSGTEIPIGVNTGSTVRAGKYFNMYTDKSGNASLVAKYDAVGNYEEGALHVTKDARMSGGQDYGAAIHDLYHNPATQKNVSARTDGQPYLSWGLWEEVKKNNNPVYKGNFVADAMGGIPVADAVIKKVNSQFAVDQDKNPFSFSMSIKDNGRNRDASGIIIPGSFVESHSGIFKDAVDGSVGIGGGSLYIQGTYIPHLDDKGKIDYYKVGDYSGKPLATGNKLSDIRIPKSDVEDIINTGVKFIDGVTTREIPTGDQSTHKGIGKQPLTTQTQPEKTHTDSYDFDKMTDHVMGVMNLTGDDNRKKVKDKLMLAGQNGTLTEGQKNAGKK